LFYGGGGICVALVIFSLLNCIFFQTNYKIKQNKFGVGYIFCCTNSELFVDINLATQKISLIPMNVVSEIIY
jgi:hypothetical protein